MVTPGVSTQNTFVWNLRDLGVDGSSSSPTPTVKNITVLCKACRAGLGWAGGNQNLIKAQLCQGSLYIFSGQGGPARPHPPPPRRIPKIQALRSSRFKSFCLLTPVPFFSSVPSPNQKLICGLVVSHLLQHFIASSGKCVVFGALVCKRCFLMLISF